MNEDPSERLDRIQREREADWAESLGRRREPERPDEDDLPAEERRHREHMARLDRIAAALEALARKL